MSIDTCMATSLSVFVLSICSFRKLKQKYRFEEVEEYVERDDGLYNCLCRFYGVDKNAPDTQDALISAAWAQSANFRNEQNEQ